MYFKSTTLFFVLVIIGLCLGWPAWLGVLLMISFAVSFLYNLFQVEANEPGSKR